MMFEGYHELEAIRRLMKAIQFLATAKYHTDAEYFFSREYTIPGLALAPNRDSYYHLR